MVYRSKVALVSLEYGEGGVGGSVRRIAYNLRHNSREPHVITVTTSRSNIDRFDEGFHVHKYGPFTGNLKSVPAKELRRFLNFITHLEKRYKYDLFHIFTLFPAGYLVGKFCKVRGKPCIINARGDDCDRDLANDSIRDKIKGFGDEHTYVFMNSRMKDNFLCLFNKGMKERIATSCFVIPNSIDPSLFTDYNTKRKGPERITIGTVGEFRRGKGLPYLLEAFRTFRGKTEGCDAQLEIIGYFRESHYKERIMEYIRKTGLDESVKITGKIPHENMLGYLSNLDIFVLPSNEEGSSNALLEAMYAGCACIATDVYGNREIVTTDDEGILVQRENPSAITAALSSLCDPQKRKMMGRCAKRRIRDAFLPEHEIKRWC